MDFALTNLMNTVAVTELDVPSTLPEKAA